MAARLSEGWAWPGALALGFAMVAPAALPQGALAPAGIVPVAVAAAIAMFLAVPLARAEWQSDPPPRAALLALGELWSLLLIGAIAAPLLQGAGGRGRVLAVLLWLVGALLVRLTGAVAVPVLAAFAGVGAVCAAVAGAVETPPWTLLEPRWLPYEDWWATAVILAFLLSAAGLGQWRGVPRAAPGRARLVWAVAGLSLLVTTALAVRHATWFDNAQTFGTPDPVAGAVGLCALAAAGTAVLARRTERGGPWVRAAIGLAATLWFAGPAAAVLPLWWGSLIPAGMAAFAFGLAVDAQGGARLVAAIAGAVLLVTAVAGWPGLPAQAGGAAAAAATVVLAVWVVGTRALMGRPA